MHILRVADSTVGCITVTRALRSNERMRGTLRKDIARHRLGLIFCGHGGFLEKWILVSGDMQPGDAAGLVQASADD